MFILTLVLSGNMFNYFFIW